MNSCKSKLAFLGILISLENHKLSGVSLLFIRDDKISMGETYIIYISLNNT